MDQILLVLFVLSLLLCVHSYFIYPLIIWILAFAAPFKPGKDDVTPSISIIIAAYNEEKHIAAKIKNTLASDYPHNKMEILVGSDGSTDKTVLIARSYESQSVRVYDFADNRGKTAVQNDLVQLSGNEILVFTDAASFLSKRTLKELVKAFADSRVGCVAGKMVFIDTEKNLTTASQGLYWRYESWLRELESRIGRLIGVDGPLYAVRRQCYVPLAANVISDLITPLLVAVQGKSVIIEEKTLVLEEPTNKSSQEMKTRRRITTRGLVGLRSHAGALFHAQHPWLAFQIISHKLLRWFVGPLVLLNLSVSILMADNLFFLAVTGMHLALYTAACMGWRYDRKGRALKWLKVPYYFCLVNAAALLGILDFFSGKQAISWKPVRTEVRNDS